MFNPHIHHQQQQQQQQFHQHLRQLQQLFQQQQPPPPPPQPSAGHHVPHPHQVPRGIPVPPQSGPPPRMVNMCQTTQTTIIAPNPMLQGAILMQQMQGNMRGFGMGGQRFRQFFAAGARSSLLGPVPMGVAIKSPMMGFPSARPVYPHVRYYNNSSSVPGSSSSVSTSTTDVAARQSDRKRDSEQITQEISDDHPGPSTATEASEMAEAGNSVDNDGSYTISDDQLEKPLLKKQRTDGLEEPIEQPIVCIAEADGVILCSDSESQPGVDGGSAVGSDVLDSDEEGAAAKVQSSLSETRHVDVPSAEEPQEEDTLPPAENQEEGEEDLEEGTNKFYCYLCSITCHNQQNFRSHMNSISHQQRMMEIQHMSNACLVTLLPRLQDTLQGTHKDGDEKTELKRWCATCQTHFTSSIIDHRQTKEHKRARKMTISSCTICKKHFRSSQIFVEHLQTLEHRKKVEMENEGCEELAKITDGILLEEEGASNGEDENYSEKQDEESKQVTLEEMDENEQYDPEAVYGSSFFVPVAGFICRLCNTFYHFESSDLHLHCKSLKHFENLKRYKTVQKDGASRRCDAEDRPERESSTDSSDPPTELSPKQPVISLCHLADSQQHEKQAEQETTPDVAILSPSTSSTDQVLYGVEEATTSQTVGDQDRTETILSVTSNSEQNVSAKGTVDKDDSEVLGKNKISNKANPTSRRRTARATNRR